MTNPIPRIEGFAEALSKLTSSAAADEDRRIVLGAVFCAAAACWLALAWGEPLFLLALPLLPLLAAAALRARQRAAEEEAAEVVEIDGDRIESAVRAAQVAYAAPAGGPPAAEVRAPDPGEHPGESQPEPEPPAVERPAAGLRRRLSVVPPPEPGLDELLAELRRRRAAQPPPHSSSASG